MLPPTQHPAPPRATRDLSSKWATEEVSQKYAGARFGSIRAEQRDPRAVRALLTRYASSPATRVLDAPCGAGRLTPTLATGPFRYVGVDVSAAMLARARERQPRARFARASLLALPFADDAFEQVVCCRLLHHLADESALHAAIAELVRVTSDLVVASFWDAGSLHALRRRLGLRRSGRDARVSIQRRRIAEHFGAAGAKVLAFRHGLRFVTQQTFLVARKG